MRAIVLEEPGKFSMTEVADPAEPKSGEARVRAARIGICGTDFHAFQGNQPFFTYPRILGHELGVEITAVGENELGLGVGDRCALEPYMNCGSCVACRLLPTSRFQDLPRRMNFREQVAQSLCDARLCGSWPL